MTKVFNCIAKELAFIDLQGNSSIRKGREDLFNVLDVFLDRLRENDDVVDVYEAGFLFEAKEDKAQFALKRYQGIGEA